MSRIENRPHRGGPTLCIVMDQPSGAELRPSRIRTFVDHPLRTSRDAVEPLTHLRNWNILNADSSIAKSAKRLGRVATHDIPHAAASVGRTSRQIFVDAYQRPVEQATKSVGELPPAVAAMDKQRFLKSELKKGAIVGTAELGKGVAFTVDALLAHFGVPSGVVQIFELANDVENAAAGPLLIVHGLCTMAHVPEDAIAYSKVRKEINRRLATGEIKLEHLQEQACLNRALTGQGTLDLFAHVRLLNCQGYDTRRLQARNAAYIHGLIDKDVAAIRLHQSKFRERKLLTRLLWRNLQNSPSMKFKTKSSAGLAKLSCLLHNTSFLQLLNEFPAEEQIAIRRELEAAADQASARLIERTDERVADAVRTAHGRSTISHHKFTKSGLGRQSHFASQNVRRAAKGAPHMLRALGELILMAPVNLGQIVVNAANQIAPVTAEQHERKLAAGKSLEAQVAELAHLPEQQQDKTNCLVRSFVETERVLNKPELKGGEVWREIKLHHLKRKAIRRDETISRFDQKQTAKDLKQDQKNADRNQIFAQAIEILHRNGIPVPVTDIGWAQARPLDPSQPDDQRIKRKARKLADTMKANHLKVLSRQTYT
jgi:hypothetical protein